LSHSSLLHAKAALPSIIRVGSKKFERGGTKQKYDQEILKRGGGTSQKLIKNLKNLFKKGALPPGLSPKAEMSPPCSVEL